MERTDEEVSVFDLRNPDTERDAFRRLYISQQAALQMRAFVMVKDFHVAEDMVHQIFVKFWESKPYLDTDIKSINGYLFAMCHTVCYDYLHQGAVKVIFHEDLGDHIGSVPDRSVKTILEKGDILRQLALISSEKQRRALFLVLIEGRSYEEAAHIMGITHNSLKAHLARGKEKLAFILRAGI